MQYPETLSEEGIYPPPSLFPSGIIAQNVPDTGGLAAITPVSGTVRASLIWIPPESQVSAITISTGSTAAVAPTNQWAAIADLNLNYLAETTNLLTAAIGANSYVTYGIAQVVGQGAQSVWNQPGNPQGLNWFYVLYMVAATTVPSLTGSQAVLGGRMLVAPFLGGNTGDTGLTTPPAMPHQTTLAGGGQQQLFILS